MSLSRFDFNSTHSFDDHRQVKRAMDEVNSLPAYAGGHIRLGNSFDLMAIKSATNTMERFRERMEQQKKQQHCDGYKQEVLDKTQTTIDNIQKYVDALKQISSYMESYSRCGC